MKKVNYIKSMLLIAFLAIGLQAWGGEVRLRVEMPRGSRSISVGDLFYITMEVSDIEGAPSKPSSVPGAKIMYFERTGQTSSFTSVNGRTTQSFSYTYTLTLKAASEGSFKFGPVSVDGHQSNAVSYSIGKVSASDPYGPAASKSSGRQAAQNDTRDNKPKFIGKGDGNLYLRANVSKTTAYEQEALVYTVKLYTTYDAIKFIGATATPKFDGFVVEESKSVDNQLSYETVGGKTFATAVIARYIIFPQMTGQLKVTGNTYTVSVDEREYYHDPLWGTLSYSTPLQLNVTPNDLTVNVKSLPLPKPSDFCGGVGQFNLTSSLPTSTLTANQGASIAYTLTGSGNLKYVSMPDLNLLYPDEIEVYSPESDIKVNVGSSNVSGQVRYDYTFLPLEAGHYQLPDVSLSYFNPQTEHYETTTAKGYALTVAPGKNSEKSQTRSHHVFDAKLKQVKASQLRHSHRAWVEGFPYWLWYIVPVVLLGSSVAIWRRYVSAHADMASFNSRRADKLARRRLRRAAAALKKGQTELFYDEMLSAMWGYLGHKLKMPTSELMRDNIKAVLAANEIPESAAESAVSLLDDCEQAKYAPATSSVQGADYALSPENIYRRGVDVINALEDGFKKK